MPTKVDIRPDGTQATQEASSGSTANMFGEDGATFRDVLDAINPLNHIPIVSDIMANVTGHKVSTASKLVGGALLGGPIGFVASLASVIFEDGAGMSPANAVYAAVTGEQDAATQVAAAEEPDAQAEEEVAALTETAIDPVETVELASLAPAAAPLAANEITRSNPKPRSTGAVLDLYGDSTASAHASYKKAQLLPYLRDVNSSKVL